MLFLGEKHFVIVGIRINKMICDDIKLKSFLGFFLLFCLLYEILFSILKWSTWQTTNGSCQNVRKSITRVKNANTLIKEIKICLVKVKGLSFKV